VGRGGAGRRSSASSPRDILKIDKCKTVSHTFGLSATSAKTTSNSACRCSPRPRPPDHCARRVRASWAPRTRYASVRARRDTRRRPFARARPSPLSRRRALGVPRRPIARDRCNPHRASSHACRDDTADRAPRPVIPLTRKPPHLRNLRPRRSSLCSAPPTAAPRARPGRRPAAARSSACSSPRW
jgi:hypothetical protein